MSFQTLEVILENGRVRPSGAETLPARSHALLTLIESPLLPPQVTCGKLAERWNQLERLSAEEGRAFADDLEAARTQLPPLKAAWD